MECQRTLCHSAPRYRASSNRRRHASPAARPSGVAYERVLLEGASKKTKDRLIKAANQLLPIFVEHALWRPKERPWIGGVMREADLRRVQDDVRDGIRMASSMGLDVSDIELPFAA